ncbi:hypothetical protein BOX15_Mlig007962g2 [Macrostomum lignano]|uniref:Zinc transporter 2 n=1 Tax=Macrostomum lignano TaxID=282301 RepID=A0A267DDB9_9PLAT|nr:hypothetical protein BOX15_Mlig007962g2 [Macrostomum lignano]
MFAQLAERVSGGDRGDKANLITAGRQEGASGAGRTTYDALQLDHANHCHGGVDQTASVDTHARKKLLIASGICLVFMTGEIIGGSMARSLAIMTDAAHLLTDFASFMISLLAVYLAARPATKAMSFGWHRAEVVGALLSVLLIWVVTGVLFYLAIERCIHRHFEVNGKIMLITSSMGVVFNVIMAATLHQHGHSHSHTVTTNRPISPPLPASQQQSQPAGSNGGPRHNLNVRAAFIHVVGDLIQSIGVMIAAIIIFVNPSYKLADPICTFIFSILVLFTTVTVLKDAMYVLMEGAPQGLDFNKVAAALSSIEGVKDVHNLRMWSLTTSRTALSVHLAIDKSSSHQSQQSQKILKEARILVREQFNITEVTIQLEEYDEEMARCHLCRHPED